MNIEQITSRETYLAFRAEWKSEYKQISEDIREGKHKISNAFRENRDASNFQRRRLRNREMATRMLEMLKEAKDVARTARSVKHAEAA
jgi:hypothetical protein